MSATPQIYVGTYKKYNEGSLFGKWLDLTDYSDKDEFLEVCYELHKDEEDPELMFQSWENIPERFISESHISEIYFNYKEKMEEINDENRQEAFEIFIKVYYPTHNGEIDIDNIFSDFEDRYYGYYSGHNPESEFTEDYVEQNQILEEMPESLQRYFDYEAYQIDLMMDFYESDGHIFHNS
jgi:antirestriction protein